MTGGIELDNALLHDQLCVASCVLAELLRQAPRTVSMAQLEAVASHPAPEVEQVCRKLWQSGMLRPDPAMQGYWGLAAAPDRMTLADLFAALLAVRH
ncbi:MAG TPA: hypothetical protein VEC01_16600 [Noviherbaspirillum sp.]|uniref:hypothetical protein n=1 Tax=Noviherbaspirillum sp. TaxID=1926288 RepID=UPI002D2BC807|nr:hypothetical protein [Noviherbaspirillum sp.]HYD96950.1 hypothetical protein [Noviherbaspirillum sp.]